MLIEMKTPGLWRRMACWLYEGMLLFGVVFLSAWLFSTLAQLRNAMQNPHGLFAFVTTIVGIYFVWFWAKGQTLAMKTWNIRIVSVQGQPITQTRALLRYCLGMLWFLPSLLTYYYFHISVVEFLVFFFAWIIVWALLSRFHPQGQFWHDAWSGTRLISSQPLSR